MPKVTDFTVSELTPRKPPASLRMVVMRDKTNDLLADVNQVMADLPSYSHQRNCLQQVKLALQQAQRELATL